MGGLLFGGARPALCVMILAVGGLLAWLAWRAPRANATGLAAGARDARRRAWFKWANILQYAGFAAVVVVANLVRRPDLIPAGLSAIVALHFLPLAYIFDNRVQYLKAAAVLAWDIAAVARAPLSSAAGVALGTGAILWAAASVQLARAHRAGRAGPGLLG